MYLVLDGNSAGPFTPDQVRAMWAANKINAQTLFFREGQTDWLPLEQIVPELFPGENPAARAGGNLGTPSLPVPACLIPGFWRRFAGILIDLIILGVGGFILGSLLFDVFVEMGVWGRLVGFVIAGAYFGVLDSAIGGGQTVGKMVLGLRVVGPDGKCISLGKSLLRFSIWGVPYFLNELELSSSTLMSWIGAALGLFLWTTLFALFYLLAFNRRTRQSVHDVFTNTYVVRSEPVGVVEARPVWKGHYAIIGAWVALGAVGAILIPKLTQIALFSHMITLSGKVEALPDVQRAGVMSGANYVYMNGQSSVTQACTLTVYYAHPVTDVEKAARAVAAIAVDDSDVGSPDVIAVKVCRAYNIGIASGSWVQVVSHSPDEWRKEIDAAAK